MNKFDKKDEGIGVKDFLRTSKRDVYKTTDFFFYSMLF